MTRPQPPRTPAQRSATVRTELLRYLHQGPRTAHELSRLVGVGEKHVAGHLEHVARSLRPAGQRLRVEPARCLACGFVFRKRERLAKPSACPVCRGQQIEAPRFTVETLS